MLYVQYVIALQLQYGKNIYRKINENVSKSKWKVIISIPKVQILQQSSFQYYERNINKYMNKYVQLMYPYNGIFFKLDSSI